MNAPLTLRPLALFAALAIPFAALAAPSPERALAMKLGESNRDAVVFRTEDRDGIGIFAPTAGGGFELRLYPGLGPDVDGIYLADADADGRRDLIARRGDGTFVPWLADASGGLVPEPVWVAPSHPGAHHVMQPSAAELNSKRLQDELHDALRMKLAGEELPSTRLDPQLRAARAIGIPDGVATATSVRFDSTGTSGVVWAMSDGRLAFTESSGLEHNIDLGTRLGGLRPGLVASGRFGPRGETAVAVVGRGSRPRLAIVQALPGGEFDVREVSTPFATFNVSVASGGLVFTPSTVNIQMGDTVHWTWAGTGHTVTSGNNSTCVIDNLFCSPTNTTCATAPTSSTGATYDHTFPSAGTFQYFCRPHCDFGMTGVVNVAAPPASPGAVPDGDSVAGVPLKIGKGLGGTLDLSWSNSCSAGATNYAVYEGTLPLTGVYTHSALNCALGNTNAANIVPGPGSRYYLLVPETAANDGSYGVDFIGGVHHQIPPAAAPCHPQLLSACP